MSKRIYAYFHLSDLQIIETALNHLEDVALETFNKSNFDSLDQIISRADSYRDLIKLKETIQNMVVENIGEVKLNETK